MLRKVLTVIVLWWVIVVYNSCCADLPYYLYQSVIVDVLQKSTIPANDSLMIFIRPKITEYVAENRSVIPAAHAWQCTQVDAGPKYSITAFRIIPEQDFIDGYPAGNDATDLFFIRYYSRQNVRYEDIPLKDLPDPDQLLLSVIWTKSRPASGRSVSFKVEIINSRGDVITGTSPVITWM